MQRLRISLRVAYKVLETTKMVECTRENAESEHEHKKELLRCQCLVCKDRLLEYNVRDREQNQTSLDEY